MLARVQMREDAALPPVHGEVPVEHPLPDLLPLDPAWELQVCELVPQQVRLHVTLQMHKPATVLSFFFFFFFMWARTWIAKMQHASINGSKTQA